MADFRKMTLQAVIRKTLEMMAAPKPIRILSVRRIITSSRGEQRDFLHLDLESRPFITSNSKAIRYPRRYVAHARCRVDGLLFK